MEYVRTRALADVLRISHENIPDCEEFTGSAFTPYEGENKYFVEVAKKPVNVGDYIVKYKHGYIEFYSEKAFKFNFEPVFAGGRDNGRN